MCEPGCCRRDGGLHHPAAGDQDDEIAEVANRDAQSLDRAAAGRRLRDVGGPDLLRAQIGEVRHPVLGQIFDGDRPEGGERVIAGDGQHARLDAHHGSDFDVSLVDGETNDHQVNLASPQRRKPVPEGEFHDLDLALRVLRLEDIDRASCSRQVAAATPWCCS